MPLLFKKTCSALTSSMLDVECGCSGSWERCMLTAGCHEVSRLRMEEILLYSLLKPYAFSDGLKRIFSEEAIAGQRRRR
jgi:hypothetical protein